MIPKIYKIEEMQYMGFKEFKEDNDILSIIRHLKSIGISLDINNGPWVAGGSVGKMLMNQPLGTSDIDLFFININDINKNYNILHQIYKDNQYVGVNSRGIGIPYGEKNINIQCISTYMYDNFYKLLGEFDFTMVQFATDGNYVACNEQSIHDLQNKILRINNVKTKTNTLSRFYKYCFKGYTPDSNTVKIFYDIVKNNPEKYVEDGY